MGLEADRVEVLLLELLYKTDYSNDFDREVRVPSYLQSSVMGGALGFMFLHLYTYISVSPALSHLGWTSLKGVILCFGLCARGQVKTVLNVLHDFEERIQESEQSWQIGAWRVRLHPARLGVRP